MTRRWAGWSGRAARAPAQRSAAPLRGLFPSVPACYPQDAHTIALGLPGAADVSFFAVYDGHGGALVSSLASQQVRSLPHTFCSRGFCLSKGELYRPFLSRTDAAPDERVGGRPAIFFMCAFPPVFLRRC